MDKDIQDMIDKGLIEVKKHSIPEKILHLMEQSKIQHYTKKQEHPDIFTGFLRTHREN